MIDMDTARAIHRARLPASPAIDGAKTAEDLLAALPDAVRDRYIALARMR